MRKKRLTVHELPHCNGREAAGIFGMSYDVWKPIFDTTYHKVIRTQRMGGGYAIQYLLTDVYRAAFPEASDHTIHMMANEWLHWKASLTIRNLRTRAGKTRKALRGDKENENNLEKTA